MRLYVMQNLSIDVHPPWLNTIMTQHTLTRSAYIHIPARKRNEQERDEFTTCNIIRHFFNISRFNFLMMPAWAKIWNLREIYEKKTSEADLGVVKDKGGGEQFLNMTRLQRSYEVLLKRFSRFHFLIIAAVFTHIQVGAWAYM